MTDYISREDALNFEMEIEADPGEIQAVTKGMAIYAEYIKGIPAADVEERKTGKWIKFSWTQGSTATGATISRMNKCSVCGGLFGRKDDRFCYNCGARMVNDDV